MTQQTTLTGNEESELAELHFDGTCKPNPGDMGYGFVLETIDGSEVKEYDHLGEGTSNKAEYQALLHGLKRAVDEGVSKIVVKGDSELIIKQVSGDYDVNDETLKPLHSKVKELEREFSLMRTEHVQREENRRADELADKAFE